MTKKAHVHPLLRLACTISLVFVSQGEAPQVINLVSLHAFGLMLCAGHFKLAWPGAGLRWAWVDIVA